MKHAVSETHLGNGIQGLFIDIPDAKAVTFSFKFLAGEYYCSKDKIELAHIMEHMVFKANEQYSTEATFMSDLEKNGATTNAVTTDHYIEYYAKCAEFEWERILNLQLLPISKPSFLKEHLVTEKKVVKEELTNYLNNYGYVLFLETSKIKSGVNRTVARGIETINNISSQDLKDFHRKTHYPANMRFVITGNLQDKKEDIKKILSQIHFENKKDIPVQKFKTPFHQSPQPIVINNPAVDKLYFYIMIVADWRLSVLEEASMQITNTLLTGGLSSRINRRARDRGLNYGVSSSCWLYPENSMLVVRSNVERNHCLELFDIMTSELRKLLDGDISEVKIKEIQHKITGRYFCRELNSRALVNHYWDAYDDLGKIQEYQAVCNALPEVSKELLIKTFRKLFINKHWYLSLLGKDADKYKDALHKKLEAIF